MQIEMGFILQVLKNKTEEISRERERYCRQGDLRKIDMSLGAEDVCRELVRNFKWHIESHELMIVERERKAALRVERLKLRRMARASVKTKEVA